MATRTKTGRFARGHSGNPNGRPRTGTSLAEKIREKVDPEKLVEIALKSPRTPRTTRATG